MTIFRIDAKALARDFEKHKEIAGLIRELEQNLKNLEPMLINARLYAKGAFLIGGDLYKKADDKLKDKSLDADERKKLTELRKAAYDVNLKVKGLAEALGLR